MGTVKCMRAAGMTRLFRGSPPTGTRLIGGVQALRHYEQMPTLPFQEQPLLMQAHLCLNSWQYGISGFGVRVA